VLNIRQFIKDKLLSKNMNFRGNKMATHEQTLAELDVAYQRIEQLHKQIEYLIRQTDWAEKRMDIIGANGPTGEHYHD